MAALCEITKGRSVPCFDSVGGLKDLYYINWDPTMILTFDPATGEITDMTEEDGTTGVTMYKWEVENASSFTESPKVNTDNGTTYWEQVLTATFKKLDIDTRKQLQMMAYGKVQCVTVDNNGIPQLLGYLRGLRVTDGTATTGTALEDLSGYTLTQTGMEKEPALWFQGYSEKDPFAGLGTPPIIIDGSSPAP
jgi:hypothetical protein